MKKVLAIVAIAAFAACGNGETKTTVDSTTVKKDSVTTTTVTKDTAAKKDTLVVKKDTATKM